ncbi:MAG: tetratricopeptide repeat protein [Deltaproteobacteria bacterium]|nr:tetratricopeptide repeat protein [Deltaproteobacteria bacterium]
MRKASRIGYDDTAIHSAIGTFLAREGLFEDARRELEMMSLYYDDLSIVHNNWGYFYHRKGEFEKAIRSFRKAIAEKPDRLAYYNKNRIGWPITIISGIPSMRPGKGKKP